MSQDDDLFGTTSSKKVIKTALGHLPSKTLGEGVDHPPHYNSGSIEVIDAIEDWELGFSLGNAVKYIARAGKKSPETYIQDLEKAIWYLNRELQRIKSK
jgi:hypothetical protein